MSTSAVVLDNDKVSELVVMAEKYLHAYMIDTTNTDSILEDKLLVMMCLLQVKTSQLEQLAYRLYDDFPVRLPSQ